MNASERNFSGTESLSVKATFVQLNLLSALIDFYLYVTTQLGIQNPHHRTINICVRLCMVLVGEINDFSSGIKLDTEFSFKSNSPPTKTSLSQSYKFIYTKFNMLYAQNTCYSMYSQTVLNDVKCFFIKSASMGDYSTCNFYLSKRY